MRIGPLLGDPRQHPAHRAPSTAGGCNAEARRRYLLESRALDYRFQSDQRIRGLSDRAFVPLFYFRSNGRGGSGESGNWRGRRDRELPTSCFVYAQHFQPKEC